MWNVAILLVDSSVVHVRPAWRETAGDADLCPVIEDLAHKVVKIIDYNYIILCIHNMIRLPVGR